MAEKIRLEVPEHGTLEEKKAAVQRFLEAGNAMRAEAAKKRHEEHRKELEETVVNAFRQSYCRHRSPDRMSHGVPSPKSFFTVPIDLRRGNA